VASDDPNAKKPFRHRHGLKHFRHGPILKKIVAMRFFHFPLPLSDDKNQMVSGGGFLNGANGTLPPDDQGNLNVREDDPISNREKWKIQQ
jgi:hypothetical protein